MAASYLRVAVIDKQNWNDSSLGHLTVTQAELLEAKLFEQLDTALAALGSLPTFQSWIYLDIHQKS